MMLQAILGVSSFMQVYRLHAEHNLQRQKHYTDIPPFNMLLTYLMRKLVTSDLQQNYTSMYFDNYQNYTPTNVMIFWEP